MPEQLFVFHFLIMETQIVQLKNSLRVMMEYPWKWPKLYVVEKDLLNLYARMVHQNVAQSWKTNGVYSPKPFTNSKFISSGFNSDDVPWIIVD